MFASWPDGPGNQPIAWRTWPIEAEFAFFLFTSPCERAAGKEVAEAQRRSLRILAGALEDKGGAPCDDLCKRAPAADRAIIAMLCHRLTHAEGWRARKSVGAGGSGALGLLVWGWGWWRGWKGTAAWPSSDIPSTTLGPSGGRRGASRGGRHLAAAIQEVQREECKGISAQRAVAQSAAGTLQRSSRRQSGTKLAAEDTAMTPPRRWSKRTPTPSNLGIGLWRIGLNITSCVASTRDGGRSSAAPRRRAARRALARPRTSSGAAIAQSQAHPHLARASSC
ncbi:hypothetical protein P154DRAFT_579645 [Amniculicola lignicola CBS 123094]|uniref:Uncharacterized protein n=1 Tax=Amniculicola lignicola CBS 123094 TaxID=1392246 RepID=A0A6A5W4B2_9PLEO|nr:hypothetical protein P154DRAFT_579645 [Amniculicola lignicola CBS 123094]